MSDTHDDDDSLEEGQVVTEEIAQQEIIDWLDWRVYAKSKRRKNKDQIEALQDAIIDVLLVINHDNDEQYLTQKLCIPLKNKQGVETLSELKYRPRLNWALVEPYMKGVAPDDAFGLINAHLCALTKKNKDLIKQLDSVDMNLSRSIATFFL